MRSFIIVVLTCLFESFTYSQIPTIVSLEIIPETISETDSIYLVARVGMNTLPAELVYHTVSDSGSYISIESCYSGGMFCAYEERVDTFNLGLKEPGEYPVYFFAQGGACDSTFSSLDSTTAIVGHLSIHESSSTSILRAFPNPVSQGLLNIQSNDLIEYRLINELGEVVKIGLVNSKHPIDVSHLQGSFYLQLFENTEYTVQQIIVW